MRYERTVPSHIEPIFLRSLAGNPGDWSFGPTDDEAWNIAGVAADRQDDLDRAIDGYDAAFLAREKQSMLEDVASIRREKEVIGPMGLTLDDKTVARLTAAAVGLMIDTARQDVRWEVTRGQFVTMPRDRLLGLAVASVNRVQACFDRVSELTTEIMAAPDLTALEAVDIEIDWPA